MNILDELKKFFGVDEEKRRERLNDAARWNIRTDVKNGKLYAVIGNIYVAADMFNNDLVGVVERLRNEYIEERIK